MHNNRKLIRSMFRVWKSITLLKHFLRVYFALIFFISFINHQSCLECRYTEPALYTATWMYTQNDDTDFRPLHMFQLTSTAQINTNHAAHIWFEYIYIDLCTAQHIYVEHVLGIFRHLLLHITMKKTIVVIVACVGAGCAIGNRRRRRRRQRKEGWWKTYEYDYVSCSSVGRFVLCSLLSTVKYIM